MLLLIMTIVTAATAAPDGWVEFDRRRAGWADSPYEYDSASIRRDGPRVRATYRYKFFYSGRPDPHHNVRIEIDCARHRARIYEHLVDDGLSPRPRRLATPTIATRIAPGSIEGSLARRLCPAAGQ